MKTLFKILTKRKKIESVQLTDLPINYIGYLTAPNGLGIGARKYLDALWNQGFYKINCVDITTIIKQKSCEITKYHSISMIKKACINIIHVNAHELPHIIKCLGEEYFKKSYNIGIWAWELPSFPSEWHDRFTLLDEIWALSTFTAKALSTSSTIPIIPISYCISEIEAVSKRTAFDLPYNEFIFLFSFDFQSIPYRKNPEGVIEAFKLAFSPNEPVRLVIKTNYGTNDEINNLKEMTLNLRVTIIDKTVSTETQHALIASCDCYVSLHRAEGLGLGMAEAMSLGKPVIATGWSGNTDFMNICNAFLVKYHLTTLKSAFSVYPAGSIVAEPDIKHAAELMRIVYTSPELRNEIGIRAKHDIENTLSEKVIGNILKERLLFITKIITANKMSFTSILKTYRSNIQEIFRYVTLQNFLNFLSSPTIINPYFDKNWYCSHYKINFKIKLFAILHYQFIGWKRSWQPHPLFDVAWYLQKNQDVKDAKVEPLQHYVTHGWKEHRSPHPLFNTSWYLKQNMDVARAQLEPLLHYLTYGWREGRQPNFLFNPDWYLLQFTKQMMPSTEPLTHYLTSGWKQSKSPSYFFDEIFNTENHNSLLYYVLKQGEEPNHSFLQSKHFSLIKLQWNRINLFFGDKINQTYYAFLIDYIALLSLLHKAQYKFIMHDGTPCIIIHENPVHLYHRSSMAKLYHVCFPEATKETICFIVLQHNKFELTKQCVSTITNLPSSELNIAIIIVDNKSDDTVINETKDCFGNTPGITLLFNPNNDGFSKGNNIGYQFAKKHLNASYIIVLNNDTEITDSNFINKSMQLFDEYAYSILGPDIITSIGGHDNPWNNYIYDNEGWKKINAIYKIKRELFKSEGNSQFIKPGTFPEKTIIFNPILQGAAYILSPIFIKQHDTLFDERIFLYGEEFLLATHCLLSGDLMIYSNELHISHKVAGSTSDIDNTEKYNINYDNVIVASDLCRIILERQAQASKGISIDFSSPVLSDLLTSNSNAIGIDLLETQLLIDTNQPTKDFFKHYVEKYALHSHVTLWITLNVKLFIDEWVIELCKKYSVNIIAVTSPENVTIIKENYPFHIFYDFYDFYDYSL